MPGSGSARKQAAFLLGKGSVAVADQATFAGANFVVNLTLARSLSGSEFGQFTTAYILFLLLAGVHTALVSEPMVVFASGRFRDEVADYLDQIPVLGHVFILPVIAMLAVAALGLAAVGETSLSSILLALAGAAPLLVGFWTFRRAAYALDRQVLAALASLIYGVCAVTSTLALAGTGTLSPTTALTSLAFAGLASTSFLGWRLGLRVWWGSRDLRRNNVFRHHTDFGRWSASAALASWLAAQSYFVFAPVLTDYEVGGALRALGLLVMPAGHAFTALGLVALPQLSKAHARGNLAPQAYRLLLFFSTLAIGYAVLVALIRGPLVALVLGSDYVPYTDLLLWLCWLPVASGVTFAASMSLKAMEATRPIFVASVAGAVATLALGVGLTATFGATGAAQGMVASGGTVSTVLTAALILQLRRMSTENSAGRSAS